MPNQIPVGPFQPRPDIFITRRKKAVISFRNGRVEIVTEAKRQILDNSQQPFVQAGAATTSVVMNVVGDFEEDGIVRAKRLSVAIDAMGLGEFTIQLRRLDSVRQQRTLPQLGEEISANFLPGIELALRADSAEARMFVLMANHGKAALRLEADEGAFAIFKSAIEKATYFGD